MRARFTSGPLGLKFKFKLKHSCDVYLLLYQIFVDKTVFSVQDIQKGLLVVSPIKSYPIKFGSLLAIIHAVR